MPYPDDFHGTTYDAERCIQCGHWEYTNDEGICDDCEYRKRRTREKVEMEKMENSSHAAYLHMMLHIGNLKAAKALGWI